MSTARTVLRLTDIVKTFPGVVALKGVKFDVVEGEVHALVGENGAGKSTLIAVAAGATLPDSGVVEIDGQEMLNPSPVAAQALGLAVVYQHQSVLPDLTVLENLYFSMPPERRPSRARAAAWARDRLADVGAPVDPGARVNELSILDRQLLEITKALALIPKVILLDEPTEALTAAETELLFERIRQITDSGTAVVYISHRLPDVLGLADRLTILRDGETRGTFEAHDVSESDVLRLMVGRPIVQAFPDKRQATARRDVPVLEIARLSGDGFHDIDLAVAPGEIVGLAGIEGNGQRSFIRALAGLEPIHQGEIRVTGAVVEMRNAGRASAHRVVHMPGDRHQEGLFLSLSVRENTSVLTLPTVSRLGVLSRRKEQALVAEQTRELSIKTPSDTTTVESLSGGNQQKVLFARALVSDPVVLLADEPTRGVDAGARIELYRILRDAAEAGKGVVVLSSDAIELQGLCDRVLVFARGHVVRRLEGDEIVEENITGAAVTATTRRAAAAARIRQLQRFKRFVKGDYAPALVILLAILGLGAYTAHSNSLFLSTRSIGSLLFLASALVLISAGQLVVLLTGGLDLSVGPLTGLVAVVLSLYLHEGAGPARYALALGVAFACAFAVGAVNYVLSFVLKLGPVLATASMLIVLPGVSLLLRQTPGGSIDSGFIAAMHTMVGPIPATFIGAAVICVVAEVVLRGTHRGIGLRAVGSDAGLAHRLGAHVVLTRASAYVLCSLFAFLGGLLLAAQIGIGDATAGGAYSLTSITAVVLGGASIYGGRGSFVGALLGALLIQESTTSTAFLGFGLEWQYWLPGIMILVSACAYSMARRGRTAGLGIA